MAAALPAKLMGPRLVRVHPRERLFARLDELRSHAAIWVHGPPGAGKTSLAASWIAARGLPVLWYQVDAGDGDPATFYYYLGLGARHAGLRKGARLPLLTPEYLGDLPGFTRRYVRALCAGLPAGCVMVFDNFQTAPDTSPFNGLVRDALAEVPPGLNLLVLGRDPPRAPFARLRASRAIGELGWEDLRLTPDESMQIAAHAPGVHGADLGALVERSGGWAAGLALLLDHAATDGKPARAPASREALFDYFASELFERLPLPTREVLLSIARLPWVSADIARALSRRPEAGDVLGELHRRHLFIDLCAGPVASYRCHALFREFLVARLNASVPVSERQRQARESAWWLVAMQDTDAALPLYLEAGDVPAAVQLVLGEAPRLAAQGRLRTLAGRIGMLPAPTVEAVPWLSHWLGVCELVSSPHSASVRLEGAFERFCEAGDLLGQTVTAASILECYTLVLHDHRPTDRWIVELLRLIDAGPLFPEVELEMHVTSALIGALTLRQPGHARLVGLAERLDALIDLADGLPSRIEAACRLMHHHLFTQNVANAERLMARMQPSWSDPRVSPVQRCTWLRHLSAYHQYVRHDAALCRQAIDTMFDLVDRHGLSFMACAAHLRAVTLHLEEGDLAGAEHHQRLALSAPGAGALAATWHEGGQSWLAMLRGDTGSAVEHSARLVACAESQGGVQALFMAWLWHANALRVHGLHADAREAVRRSREVNATLMGTGEYLGSLIEADLSLQQGDVPEARERLSHAFALARRKQMFNTLQWLPDQMSRLCGFALEHDIERDFVVELIRRRGLPAPPHLTDARWPWPLKLRVLGGFEILRDDEPLQVEGKAQRKPLALLQALVALGGRDVAEDRLIDILWPDPLQGAEQKALDVTLHRLRKLLGHDRAVLVTGRRVSLNRGLVWVDLWTLEDLLAPLTDGPHAASVPASQLEQAASLACRLYRGDLLAGEPDSAWLLPVRQRVRGRVERFVLRLGDQREATRRWADAEALYRHAIDLHPGVEVYHQRLIGCLSAQGRLAEAREAYKQCRQVLAVMLGVPPSCKTDDIATSLQPD